MTDKKLFRVNFDGHYSLSYGWDDGWNVYSVYPCTMIGNVVQFTFRGYNYECECEIEPDFLDRWGGYVDCLRDNAGSRSAQVYVFASDEYDAKTKAHDVIMRFRPPTAYYKKEVS